MFRHLDGIYMYNFIYNILYNPLQVTKYCHAFEMFLKYSSILVYSKIVRFEYDKKLYKRPH